MTTSVHKHTVSGKATSQNAAGTVGADLDALVARVAALEAAQHSHELTPDNPTPVPPSGATLDTTRDGWGLFSGVYVKGDPGFGRDSAFDATKTALPTNTALKLSDLSQVVVNPDNSLRITAERKSGMTNGLPYASACIGTRTTFAQRYGVFEARFRYPKGQGSFPAFWLLEAGKLSTPPEVDIMEAYPGPGMTPSGGSSGAGVAIFTNHAAAGVQYRAWDGGRDLTADFHTWRLEWSASSMRVTCDGAEVGVLTANLPSVPMYPILNLAMGAASYRVDATTPAALHMDVAYVRVTP